ncbi:MAG: hypothetical protein GC134_00970 [Proteobacteria bacterium]|nr:hypothetical protein [Pseudomonadota bacterium]
MLSIPHFPLELLLWTLFIGAITYWSVRNTFKGINIPRLNLKPYFGIGWLVNKLVNVPLWVLTTAGGFTFTAMVIFAGACLKWEPVLHPLFAEGWQTLLAVTLVLLAINSVQALGGLLSAGGYRTARIARNLGTRIVNVFRSNKKPLENVGDGESLKGIPSFRFLMVLTAIGVLGGYLVPMALASRAEVVLLTVSSGIGTLALLWFLMKKVIKTDKGRFVRRVAAAVAMSVTAYFAYQVQPDFWVGASVQEMIFSTKMQKLIGNGQDVPSYDLRTQEGVDAFNRLVPALHKEGDMPNLRLVGHDLALKQARERIGADGSWLQVAPEMTNQKINGSFWVMNGIGDNARPMCFTSENAFWWAGTLTYVDFWKFFWNTEYRWSVPAYVLVSATNADQVYYVSAYGPSCKPTDTFNDSIKAQMTPVKMRVQKYNGYLFGLKPWAYGFGTVMHGLTDHSFEVTNDGAPRWVVTTYTHAAGMSVPKAVGVLVIDPRHGLLHNYSIAKAPEWIDRIQPEGMVYDLINHWGSYIGGYDNWRFAKKGLLQVTNGREDLTLVGGAAFRSYWTTGIQAHGVTNNESAAGYMFVNTRNQSATFFRVEGATEAKADRSAEGLYQAEGYKAGESYIVNIADVMLDDGHGGMKPSNLPAILVTLVDNAGLIKKVAIVPIYGSTLVGGGDTVQEAIADLHAKIAKRGGL